MADKKEVLAKLEAACARRATIEFIKSGDEGCEYIEKGMKAKVLSVTVEYDSDDPREELWKLRVDFEPFDSHNRPLESADFFDGSLLPCLTAREAGLYRPQDYFYVNRDSLGDMFRIVEAEEEMALTKLAESIDYLDTVWKDMAPRLGHSGHERCLREAIEDVLKNREAIKV